MTKNAATKTVRVLHGGGAAASYKGPRPARERTYVSWYRDAVGSPLLPEDFVELQSGPKDAEYLERIGAPKLHSWRAYVWLQKNHGLPRFRKFEHWVWDDTERERTCAINRRRNRASFEKRGLVSKGDGTEIDHINGNCTDNRPSNLQVLPACAHNRKHDKQCHLRNPKVKKGNAKKK